MPYSDSSFDPLISKLLRRWAYHYYLDVGPGAGKYARLIRQQFPNARIEALEPDRSYVRRFNLGQMYDAIAIASARQIVDGHPSYHTECAIVGDSIEHMTKSEGTDLLHYLVYRSKTILVVFPNRYIQYSWEGHAGEAHRSAWARGDFRDFTHRWHTKGYMRLAVIDGYLSYRDAVIERATANSLRQHPSITAWLPAKIRRFTRVLTRAKGSASRRRSRKTARKSSRTGSN
jgi:hypothetical protein